MIYFCIVLGLCLMFIIFRKYNRKYFLWVTFFVLFLFAAIRKSSIWIDLIGYEKKHIIISCIKSWNDFFHSYLLSSKDVGFYTIEWIATKFGITFQVWIAIIAAFFLVIICRLIYKKSYHPLISVLLFLGLGFYSFSLSGLRQTVAIAITVLAYNQLDDDCYIKYILLTLIASLFHRSAIIFLMLLPLKNVKIGKFHIIGSGIGVLAFFVYNNQLKYILNTYFFTENYSGYSAGTTTLNYTKLIILLSIFMFCLFYYKRVCNSSLANFNGRNEYLSIHHPLLLYNSLFLGVIFQLYASFFAEMFRISMYFSLYSILLVPLSLKNESNPNYRKLLAIGICFILVFYIIYSGGLGVNYQTFWNSNI